MHNDNATQLVTRIEIRIMRDLKGARVARIKDKGALQATQDLNIPKVIPVGQFFNFFESAQKRSNFSENDIDIYLRLFVKYGAKLPSQKKVIRVQS
jgi:hypothetical protein